MEFRGKNKCYPLRDQNLTEKWLHSIDPLSCSKCGEGMKLWMLEMPLNLEPWPPQWKSLPVCLRYAWTALLFWTRVFFTNKTRLNHAGKGRLFWPCTRRHRFLYDSQSLNAVVLMVWLCTAHILEEYHAGHTQNDTRHIVSLDGSCFKRKTPSFLLCLDGGVHLFYSKCGLFKSVQLPLVILGLFIFHTWPFLRTEKSSGILLSSKIHKEKGGTLWL